MSKKPTTKRPHGQMRLSQLITTFGPGAMMDLPDYSVLVAGLQDWSPGGVDIQEPRLVAKLLEALQLPQLSLRTPPAHHDDPSQPPTGISGFQFPEWFTTQDALHFDAATGARSRRLAHRAVLVDKRYILDDEGKKRSTVPVRFVRACPRGHLGDINWYVFVHGEQSPCKRRLWIDERGSSGDLTNVVVRCECGARRPLGEVALQKTALLGYCDGARPWLGPKTRELDCHLPNRLLIRTASNAYFPQLLRVISLPDRDELVKKAVDKIWSHLECVESLTNLQYERGKTVVRENLLGLTDEEVLEEILARKSGQSGQMKGVKQAELETLIACQEEAGRDELDANFYARALPPSNTTGLVSLGIERVVLVHRLREVVAQVGFTRFEAAAPTTDGELDMEVQRAALAAEVSWLPAIENRGEGVFLQYNSARIEEWAARPNVRERGRELIAGLGKWKEEHKDSGREFPGLPYLMLHTFSHLLLQAVSLECGYPASSIRERVYANHEVGYGVLLYTGSSDAEGTLGGLVEVGRHIETHIRRALEMGELCSNDPVCAQHVPANLHEGRFLLGAACHGCLLISETSCEMFNAFLDRSLVVPTIEQRGVEFFGAAPT